MSVMDRFRLLESSLLPSVKKSSGVESSLGTISRSGLCALGCRWQAVTCGTNCAKNCYLTLLGRREQCTLNKHGRSSTPPATCFAWVTCLQRRKRLDSPCRTLREPSYSAV